MKDWIQIAFLAVLSWLAWRAIQALGAAPPTAVYQFGDIISAPSIIGAMPGANVGNSFAAADTTGVPSSAGPALSAYDGLRSAAYRDPRRGYEVP
jgi:hypothetical protein